MVYRAFILGYLRKHQSKRDMRRYLQENGFRYGSRWRRNLGRPRSYISSLCAWISFNYYIAGTLEEESAPNAVGNGDGVDTTSQYP